MGRSRYGGPSRSWKCVLSGKAILFGQTAVNFIKERIEEIIETDPAEIREFRLHLISEHQKKYPLAKNSLSMWTVLTESFKAPFGTDFDINNT
jgi:hypothetical protein